MTIENVMKVLKCFPRSYMNCFGECTLCEKGNLYITVKNCETETDIKCKLLEWCSRSAAKGEPYRTEKKNIEPGDLVTSIPNTLNYLMVDQFGYYYHFTYEREVK